MAESKEELKSLLRVKEWRSLLKAQYLKNWDHDIQSHHCMANRSGESGSSGIFFFLGPKSLWTVTETMNMKMLAPWKESYDKPRQHIKKQRHHFADKVCLVKAMIFPVVMYGCERWTIKKAEELMLSNCGAEEDSWESLGLQEDQTSQS